jgi:hypothetical protein
MTSIECELGALRNKKKKQTLNKKDVERVFPEGSFSLMTKGARYERCGLRERF